jgi:hypothetical protein
LELAATLTFARPFVARAEARTATVWWVQGFAEEEDIACEGQHAGDLAGLSFENLGELCALLEFRLQTPKQNNSEGISMALSAPNATSKTLPAETPEQIDAPASVVIHATVAL